MPIKGTRMRPCSVPKCKMLHFYAIIYDCRHSKYINDRLRCAGDNGGTCLKLQNRFLFWRPQTFNGVHTRAHTCAAILSLLPTFEMQAARVNHRAHLPATHLRHLNWREGPLSISPLPLSCLLRASPFTVIKDSFVTPSEASRRQETSNRRCRATHKAKRWTHTRKGRV